MKYIGTHYVQNNQNFYSVILPFHAIKNSTHVLTYGSENKLGYQRKLDGKHVKKISDQLLSNSNSFLLPTSIILSIDEEEFQKFITKTDNVTAEIDFPEEGNHFRIVDGQHRIEGLKKAIEKNDSLNNFMLNVIILITEKDRQIIEVEVFRDINSKAKKLRTDLTQLSIFNHELLGRKKLESEEDLIRYLSSKIAYFLNETSKDLKMLNLNVWSNAILIDIHEEHIPGIIGFSSFISSIKNIVKRYIDNSYELSDFSKNGHYDFNIINVLDEHALIISNMLLDCWNIVRLKWKGCFSDEVIIIDKIYYQIYYDKDYYIQKTTGINAIHMIINETVEFDKESQKWDYQDFDRIIFNSNVSEKDWIVGGKFAGMTSGTGFKKAKNIINNQYDQYEF